MSFTQHLSKIEKISPAVYTFNFQREYENRINLDDWAQYSYDMPTTKCSKIAGAVFHLNKIGLNENEIYNGQHIEGKMLRSKLL